MGTAVDTAPDELYAGAVSLQCTVKVLLVIHVGGYALLLGFLGNESPHLKMGVVIIIYPRNSNIFIMLAIFLLRFSDLGQSKNTPLALLGKYIFHVFQLCNIGHVLFIIPKKDLSARIIEPSSSVFDSFPILNITSTT